MFQALWRWMMNTVRRARILTVLCAALGGGLLAVQGNIQNLFWRVVVAGAGTALLGATLLLYGEATRGEK